MENAKCSGGDMAKGSLALEPAESRNIGEFMEINHAFETRGMKKQFGTVATLGTAFSILNTWVGASASLAGPIALGGPRVIIWGNVCGSVLVGTLCIGLAEMASAMPAAGGPYHYTFIVSPPHSRKFWSFFVGWCTVISWWFISSATTLFMASFVTGIVALWHPAYVPQTWHVWLIYVGLLTFVTLINIGANSVLAKLASISLIVSLAGFLISLVTVLAMHSGQQYRSASFVFGSFENISGWSSNGTAYVIGWILSCWLYLGLDATTHLSEEMERPEIEVPKAMVGALLIGLGTSFIFLVCMLLCITDMVAILEDPSGVPILAIYLQATGSRAAATGLCLIIFVSSLFSMTSAVAVAGRTTWSFARDNGLIFSKYFSEVNAYTGQPLRATVLNTCLSICYGAIYIGSPVAFQSLVGSVVIMLFSVYSIPQAILAVRGRKHLPRRPFDLGKAGLFFNLMAPILFVFVTVIACLPVTIPVTVQSMNYLSVIGVGCWVLVALFYGVYKKGRYQGPLIEVGNLVDR